MTTLKGTGIFFFFFDLCIHGNNQADTFDKLKVDYVLFSLSVMVTLVKIKIS